MSWTVDYEPVWQTVQKIQREQPLLFAELAVAMKQLPSKRHAAEPFPGREDVYTIILAGLLAEIVVMEDQEVISIRSLAYTG